MRVYRIADGEQVRRVDASDEARERHAAEDPEYGRAVALLTGLLVFDVAEG